jgi:hypothetical protein
LLFSLDLSRSGHGLHEAFGILVQSTHFFRPLQHFCLLGVFLLQLVQVPQ